MYDILRMNRPLLLWPPFLPLIGLTFSPHLPCFLRLYEKNPQRHQPKVLKTMSLAFL